MAADRKRKPAHGDARSTPNLDEERYRAVIETSADGFWMVGGDERILEANEAYIRRSGYSRSELRRTTGAGFTVTRPAGEA